MKISKNLIIFSIFSLHLLCMSDGESCESMTCSNSGPFIRYPFRIKDLQPKSCGSPGFDVYCDDESGKHFLDLPSAGNFSIDYIYYSIREIDLSDPDDCLPRKLMSLDLNKISPFLPRGEYVYFRLYNCSGDYYNYLESDRIGCLSKSNYTVISTGVDTPGLDVSNCTFLKTVSAPSPGYYFSALSSVSRIELTWNQTYCASCDSPATRPEDTDNETGLALGLALGFGLPAMIILIICACCKRKEQTNQSANDTTSRNAVNEVSSLPRQSTAITTGLDQITIDSYPVVVIGESGRLIKPDDDTCPICLSKYSPHEMLKMLPECLHRFHADCIDEWLRAKAICPICRISPPRS